MGLEGGQNGFCEHRIDNNIEDVKKSTKEFLKKLNSIANDYYILWENINKNGNISNINQKFKEITEKYVENFHELILSLENKLNEYINSSLKQEISETLGGTPQENTSKVIIKEIKILIDQIKENAFDKYLKYESNDETGKFEIYFKLPPSNFEHEPTVKFEEINFGTDFLNPDFKIVTELFFLCNTLERVKNEHKDLIISLSNEYCKHVYEILSLDEDDKRIYDKVFEYLQELKTSDKKKVLDEDVEREIIKRFNKNLAFKDMIDTLLLNYRDLFDIDDKSMESIQTSKN